MSTLKPMTEARKAYIAGIIDGEGCVELARSGTRFNLRVTIKTTSELLAKCLAEWTGLGPAVHKRQDQRKDSTRMPCYVWYVFTNQALELLEAVAPYICIKSEQVAVAIKYQQLPTEKRVERGREFAGRLKAFGLRELARARGGESAT